MADKERPSDPPSLAGDRLAEFLARTRPAAGVPGPCPDPGLLAGYAEGRLLPREVEAAESHLARCGECRSAVAGLIREAAVPAPAAVEPARPALRLLPRLWLLAIPVAAAVVFAFLMNGTPRVSPARDTEVALADAARDLAAARPDLFGSFRPLSRAELRAPILGPKRGGSLALLRPAGRVLEVRPGFRWESMPAVERWTVTLLAADGTPLWSEETAGASFAWPAKAEPLRPGARYLWEVKGEGPLGPERSRRSFAVASAEERRAFEEGTRSIDEAAPEALRPLLRAHLALRAGLAEEAEAAAREALARSPEDLARETLARVLDELGEAPR